METEPTKVSVKTMKETIRRAGLSTADMLEKRDIEARYKQAQARLEGRERRLRVKKRKEVLRLRSLVVRGRAKKSSDAMIEPSFRVPDGVLWNVLSFWPPQRPKTFWRAQTYDGPRPGCVFATRGGRTGYWVDAEPQVEYQGELDRVTDAEQGLWSSALAPGYRGPGWLPGNPNWLSPNFWLRGGHE